MMRTKKQERAREAVKKSPRAGFSQHGIVIQFPLIRKED
jgi:hypothetical protein